MCAKPAARILKTAVLLQACSVSADAFESLDMVLDQLGDHLTYTLGNGDIRARVSGLADLEAYFYEDNPPGLITDDGSPSWQGRLSLFLDVQVGERVYFFTQTRVDRGFDPGANWDFRLDEYAIRFSPWTERRLSIQLGQFATIAGQWTRRHLSWDNPFITAPLFYEQPTSASDRESYSDGGQYSYGYSSRGNPIIWGPAYASGAAVSGVWGQVEWAASLTNAALMSRPEYWPVDEVGFDEPTFTARLAWRPDLRWTFGVSGSRGAYLGPGSAYAPPPGLGREDFVQTVWLADFAYEHRHLQIWAELIHAVLESPYMGERRANGYFLEVRYKVTPRLSVASRWNQIFFSDQRQELAYMLPYHSYSPAATESIRRGREQSRIDLALTWRFNAHVQVQLEGNAYWGADARSSPTAAIRWTVRF